jgi:hypothetical protein
VAAPARPPSPFLRSRGAFDIGPLAPDLDADGLAPGNNDRAHAARAGAGDGLAQLADRLALERDPARRRRRFGLLLAVTAAQVTEKLELLTLGQGGLFVGGIDARLMELSEEALYRNPYGAGELLDCNFTHRHAYLTLSPRQRTSVRVPS